MIVIKLAGERPKSWNELKRMNRYTFQREVEAVKWRVYQALQETFGADIPQFTRPVEMRVTVYFVGRRYDVSNIPEKLYEDGLKGNLIANDSPIYVTEWHKRSQRATKTQPAGVVIEMWEAA